MLKRTFAASAIDGQPLRAVSLIRPMIGRSGPALVKADDGTFHVVKTWGNLKHPNALANELLASALCSAAGLAVPPSRPIELTRKFLDSTSLSAIYDGYTHHPVAGIHYASPFVLPRRDNGFLMEHLVRHLVPFVQNRRDFLGMYMLDICFKHRGPRQAIFIKSKHGLASRAVFIDHDQMFGGSNWEVEGTSSNPHHRTVGLYHGLFIQKDVASWMRMFDTKLLFTIDSAVKHIPSEWYTGNLASLQEWLHHRVQSLPGLINQALARDPIFRDYADATMHVPPSRVCQIGP